MLLAMVLPIVINFIQLNKDFIWLEKIETKNRGETIQFINAP